MGVFANAQPWVCLFRIQQNQVSNMCDFAFTEKNFVDKGIYITLKFNQTQNRSRQRYNGGVCSTNVIHDPLLLCYMYQG